MNQMMKNKKAIALLLLVAMLFSIMPTAVFAAETGSTSDTITAYVTIVDQGNVVVMHKEVQIKDRNNDGKCDIDEALYATHETYYPGGAEAGYQQSDGWISMLWGSSSGCMYRINNISANGLTDSINQNDYLVAYNLKDTATWSDIYGYFDKHQVTTNSALTLSLLMSGYDENWSPITKPVKDATITIDGKSTEYQTAKDGKVTLSFAENGTYTISATTESMILVPPICVVDYNPDLTADKALEIASDVLNNGITVNSGENIIDAVQSKIDQRILGIVVKNTEEESAVMDSDGDAKSFSEDKAESINLKLTSSIDVYQKEVTVPVDVTVLADSKLKNTSTDISKLIETIAVKQKDGTDKWYSNWLIMDMGNYGSIYKNDTLDGTAKQKYINTAISSVKSNTASETDYSKAILALTALGIDASTLKPLNGDVVNAVELLKNLEKTTYSATGTPYTLMAYNQGYSVDDNTYPDEEELITKLLALQKPDGGWHWNIESQVGSVDETGDVLAALAFYKNYKEEPTKTAVNNAIKNGIKFLDNQILDNGTYEDSYSTTSNANSTARAIIGLASVYDINVDGLDASTSEMLFENSVKGLLQFALSDYSGFGNRDNKSVDGYSTAEGFRALIAASQVMKTGKAFNVYDFSGNTLVPGYEKEITPSGGSGSYVPKDDKITVKVSIKAIDGYWIQNKSVTLEEDSTVSDALLKAIKNTGITQEGAEDGYIEYMEYNGEELGEFTHGDNSGWMYKVNGTAPNVGVTDYSLRDGDKILFYFTKDYTNESTEEDEEKDEDKKDEESKPTTTPVNEVFKDVDTHWASASIQFVYDNGILKGVSATDFAPEATFNRAMMATVLHRLAGNPEHGWHYPFRDVFDMAWYCGPIAWAYENNLIGGMTTTSYAPESPITREQLAVMLMRYAQFQGYDTSKSVALYQYQDAGKVSDYAQPAMEWAVSIGLIGGRTLDTLAPQDTATRAEVSVMLERFITMFQPVVEEESTTK